MGSKICPLPILGPSQPSPWTEVLKSNQFVPCPYYIDPENLIEIRLQLLEPRVPKHGIGFNDIPVFDEDGADGRGDDVRTAHVADSEHQLVLAVAPADDRQTTEHDGVRALLGLRQLGEYQPGHQRLDEHAAARLKHQHEQRDRALRLNHSEPAAGKPAM